MRYKEGTDKYQYTFMPSCLDDYVPEGHICRMIVMFTGMLDMVVLGFKNAICKESGNRPFDPRMMLNLYIYGYLNRIRSSRRLEAETIRNVEVMWLMEGLTPDDKTICNFRKDNAAVLKKVFREFTKLCQGLELYGGEVIAVDGTKIRANNSRKNNHNKATVERELSRIDKHIREYMNALDESDKADTKETPIKVDPEKIKKALEKLNKRKLKFEGLKEKISETDQEVSTIDPDSRLMHQGGDARALDVCYNVQVAVDGKYKLPVDFEVSTNPSDQSGQLKPMTDKVKEVTGKENLTVLADTGYYNGEDIAKCEENGAACLIKKPNTHAQSKEYLTEYFKYDKERDCYICPQQKELRFSCVSKCRGKEFRDYANYSACGKCPKQSGCTKGKYRRISRPLYQNVLDIVDERTKNNPELYRQRQEIVEHPFGTIKKVWSFSQYLCRRKEKVNGETSLAFLAYCMRRVFNIFKDENRDLTAEMRAIMPALFPLFYCLTQNSTYQH
jgi:transposase